MGPQPHHALVTHRPQVLQIVNRIIVMDNGKVVMDGPRDLVLQNSCKTNRPKQPTSNNSNKLLQSNSSNNKLPPPLNRQHNKAKGRLKPTYPSDGLP